MGYGGAAPEQMPPRKPRCTWRKKADRGRGRASDRQGAARRWGTGAQPPSKCRRGGRDARGGRKLTEAGAGRATAREPHGDGVRGRSPRASAVEEAAMHVEEES